MSMESRRRRLEGKKKPAGLYAYIEADRAGWWINLTEVLPNGHESRIGSLEAFRQYDTLGSIKANLKKHPYNVDFIKMKKMPQGIY